MSEKVVTFQEDQQGLESDFDDIGVYTRASLDHIVGDGITDERRYVGLSVTKESSTSIRVAPGRLYDAGAVYAHEAETVISMNIGEVGLPVVNRKRVGVYAWGKPVDTNSEPRDFLVNPETETVEPRTITTRNMRICYVEARAGEESVDPLLPAAPSDRCLVATLILTPAGIEDGSITMQTATQLDSVESVAGRTKELETFRLSVEPTVGSLVSEFAAINARTLNKANAEDVVDLRGLIARLNKALNMPPSYAEAAADDFKDASLIDDVASANTYQLSTEEEGGTEFPYATLSVGPLALFNPYEPGVYRSPTDLILPKHVDVVAVEAQGNVGTQSITQYSAQTIVTRQLTGYQTKTYYR